MKKIILLSITLLIGMNSLGKCYWNQQKGTGGSATPQQGDDSYLYHRKPNDAHTGGKGGDFYIHFKGGSALLNASLY